MNFGGTGFCCNDCFTASFLPKKPARIPPVQILSGPQSTNLYWLIKNNGPEKEPQDPVNLGRQHFRESQKSLVLSNKETEDILCSQTPAECAERPEGLRPAWPTPPVLGSEDLEACPPTSRIGSEGFWKTQPLQNPLQVETIPLSHARESIQASPARWGNPLRESMTLSDQAKSLN